MTSVSDDLLRSIAGRVSERIAQNANASGRWPARFAVLVLSGDGIGLDTDLARFAEGESKVVGVCDCATAASGALALAATRIGGFVVADGESPDHIDRVVSGATRVFAPSLDLSLASRVAQLQADSPAARVILRSLLGGIPVSATLAARDFSASTLAPEGVRRALGSVVEKLRSLGIHVHQGVESAKPASFVVAASGGGHPSQDRFSVPGALNEFVEFLENRPCSIETGKPCIDCGACEARGF